jgi:hypothetical protein
MTGSQNVWLKALHHAAHVWSCRSFFWDVRNNCFSCEERSDNTFIAYLVIVSNNGYISLTLTDLNLIVFSLTLKEVAKSRFFPCDNVFNLPITCSGAFTVKNTVELE